MTERKRNMRRRQGKCIEGGIIKRRQKQNGGRYAKHNIVHRFQYTEDISVPFVCRSIEDSSLALRMNGIMV